jgi:periplasmic divalent cation tolerance protein
MPRNPIRQPKTRSAIATILVLSTVGEPAVGRRIATALVEEGLAACVNVTGPVDSTYRWRDAVTTETEHLMLIKTRAALYPALEQRLKELHPYEVPEIIAIELRAGAKSYLEWVLQSTVSARKRVTVRGRMSAASSQQSTR